MTTSAPREAVGRRAHVADLLARYPDVAPAEAAEILRFLKKAPPLDTALLLSDEALRPALGRFRADHRAHFAFGRGDYLFLAALLAAVAAVCVLLWDLGAAG